MAKKNRKAKLSPATARTLFGGIVIILATFLLYQRVIDFIRNSNYFTIKEIWYESTLKFMESSEIIGLKGKNIFDVNLTKIEKQLQSKYPQCAQLRVLKRLPNQILVTANQRVPFAQLNVGDQLIVLDEKGVVLSLAGDLSNQLPVITGVSSLRGRVGTGMFLNNLDLQVALRMMKAFHADKVLSSLRISKVDVSNLSQISLFIGENLKVLMDQEGIAHKLKMLSLLLSQAKLEPDVKYIDLRFKEPILGKK